MACHSQEREREGKRREKERERKKEEGRRERRADGGGDASSFSSLKVHAPSLLVHVCFD